MKPEPEDKALGALEKALDTYAFFILAPIFIPLILTTLTLETAYDWIGRVWEGTRYK